MKISKDNRSHLHLYFGNKLRFVMDNNFDVPSDDQVEAVIESETEAET